jgi:protein-L-isoaspartate(D-aspartate) O-methyltransferase
LKFELQRKSLVEGMRSAGCLQSKAIENAFLAVPREKFFPKETIGHSYIDNAFPIGLGQTISQPCTIAAMLGMLSVKKGNRVLEVGAGSGYVAALLAGLVGGKGKVFGIELLHELHQKATRTLLELGCKNIFLKCGDGTQGWKEKAPFDRILISAACSAVPKPLLGQLSKKGMMVVPIGSPFSQDIVLFKKENGIAVEKQRKQGYVFVPLKGKGA